METSSLPSSPPTEQRTEPAERHRDDMRTRILPRSQLKSNIPRPVPYVRLNREPRSKSCSSSCFKRSTSVCPPPTPKIRSHSNCTSHSEPTHLKCKSNRSRQSADSSLSKAASTAKSGKSQYSDVKARIDNSTPISLLLKSQRLQSKDLLMRHSDFVDGNIKENRELVNDNEMKLSSVDDNSKESVELRNDNKIKDGSQINDISRHSSVFEVRSKTTSVDGGRSKDGSLTDDRSKVKEDFLNDQKYSEISQMFYGRRKLVEEPPGDNISKTNSSNMLGRENKSLTPYSDSESCCSSIKLHIPEGDAGILKKNDFFECIEGDKSYFLKKCARGFLSSFEKQMEEVAESWLQLICDMIVTKMTIGKSVASQLSLGGSKLSPRDEITKFFQNLPTQGELLYRKLCSIEEDQMNTLQVVIKNIVALIKEHEGLKRKYSKLQETCERSESQLKTELAILSQENKELDQKYLSVIEKYELEKSRIEEQEEHQVAILKKMLELRNVTKHVEMKCKELEKRGERMDTNRQKLEDWIKDLEMIHEKENKKHEDLSKKHAEAMNIINKLKQEIKESENSKTHFEEQVKELQEEIANLKATLENSKQKRTELENEVFEKNKKIIELEREMIAAKANKKEGSSRKEPSTEENNLELVKDLVAGVEKRNVQIQELKKKINRLEHMLREKSSREEKLLSHVTKLNKKYNNGCVALTNQIKELQNSSKCLQHQVSELEKVLGQKTLELDQRDRMIKELKELARLKSDSDLPTGQSRKHHSTERASGVETDKGLLSRNKKMIEMFSLLEQKQMEIMKLENRLWGLQKTQNYERKTEKEQEKEAKGRRTEKEQEEKENDGGMA